MKKAIIRTPDAPAAIGTYSQAVKVGNTVYLSGQIPLDPANDVPSSERSERVGPLPRGEDRRILVAKDSLIKNGTRDPCGGESWGSAEKIPIRMPGTASIVTPGDLVTIMERKTVARSQLRHSTPLRGGRTKPTVSADYIVGLTDGEGCFYVLIKPPYNKKGGALIQLNFHIKVQASDKDMLEKVKNALGCGNVYFQHERRANHAQCYRYTVNSHRDILRVIIPFFKKHRLMGSSKRNNFGLFCKIADLVAGGAHHSRRGLNQIKALKSQMNRRARVVREIRTLRGDAK